MRVLVIGAIAPEGVAYLRERGIEVDEVSDTLAKDELYGRLTRKGHPGVQPPFDAFWGGRYAIVADPDGNQVGLMSPIDAARRSWPPEPSPDP